MKNALVIVLYGGIVIVREQAKLEKKDAPEAGAGKREDPF
jgi:hypothetical protein